MTLLTSVQNACAELALPVPASVVGNTDQQVVQFLALANREGKEMAAYESVWGGWPELRAQYTFTLVPVGPYTGTTTNGSTTISSLSSVASLVVGYGVAGNGVPQSATIVSIGASSIVISIPCTSTATGVSLQFGQIAYDFPSDLQYFITQTGWDRNFRWQLLGPLDAQEWQVLISGLSAAGPRLRFRVMGGKYYINPVPGATQTDQIAYEYITQNWCRSTASTTLNQTAWAADSDVYAWPDDTLTLGLKWRFLRAKGLDYAEEQDTWQRALDRQAARSGGSRAVPLNATARGLRLLSNVNLPDTGFGA